MLTAWRERITSAQGRRRPVIAFAAGAVSVLAMAPFHLWPVLFLTLPVLVWLLDGDTILNSGRIRGHDSDDSSLQRRSYPRIVSPNSTRIEYGVPLRTAFASGWWFGFGYFVLGLFWIGEAFLVEAEKYALLLPFAVTLLPAGLAIFFGAAAAAARVWWPAGLARVLVLAVTIAVAEWLRGNVLSGLPWNTLGYALTYPLPLMQSAAIFGTYGLTLWTVLVGAAPLVLAGDAPAGPGRKRAALAGLAIAALPLAAFTAYGALRLAQAPAPMVEGVRMRIVQPSVPQREKWMAEHQGRIFRDHLDLSRQDARGRVDDLAGITHVVWPEAAMPFLPLEHPEALAAIAQLLPSNAYLLSGGLRRVTGSDPAHQTLRSHDGAQRAGADPTRIYNSMLVFGRSGLVTVYDKNHLVPFGEYLPLPDLWRKFGLRGLVEMRGAFAAGQNPRPLVGVPGLPRIGALVCYETIFPGDVVQGTERPGLLLSITNDGWFGNTTGPRQHFHQARVRAVEEGLPLIRAANNGISAVFDAEGRLLGHLDLDARGVIDTALPTARPATTYSRNGEKVLLISAVLFLLAAAWLGRHGG